MKLPSSITWRVALIRNAADKRYIREYAGPNKGEGVQWCQKSTGNAPPDYWCMSFVHRCGVGTFGRQWPLILSGSCEQVRQFAKRAGAVRTRAEFDAHIRANPEIVLAWVGLLLDATHAHHTFFVGALEHPGTSSELVQVVPPSGVGFYTTEGNAADPEKPSSRDGNGVYTGRIRGGAGDRSRYEFIDLEAFT